MLWGPALVKSPHSSELAAQRKLLKSSEVPHGRDEKCRTRETACGCGSGVLGERGGGGGGAVPLGVCYGYAHLVSQAWSRASRQKFRYDHAVAAGGSCMQRSPTLPQHSAGSFSKWRWQNVCIFQQVPAARHGRVTARIEPCGVWVFIKDIH